MHIHTHFIKKRPPPPSTTRGILTQKDQKSDSLAVDNTNECGYLRSTGTLPLPSSTSVQNTSARVVPTTLCGSRPSPRPQSKKKNGCLCIGFSLKIDIEKELEAFGIGGARRGGGKTPCAQQSRKCHGRDANGLQGAMCFLSHALWVALVIKNVTTPAAREG